MTTLQLLIDGQHELGEGIVWCDTTQRLLWTDIAGSKLWCHTLVTQATRYYDMPERLASFALTDNDDRLLLGLASQLAYFNFSDGLITPICDVEPDLATTRVNDGRCDRQGRFVFGTMDQSDPHAPIGSFYRLNLDLTLERLPLDRVAIANSICFSVDGRIMYYCDSPARKIYQCSYEPVSGAISDPSVFADLGSDGGVPDGSTIDADGYLWNAQWGGHRVVRYAPDGRIDRVVEVPVSQPTCVAFGGPLLNRLYVTSARESLTDTMLRDEPSAGGVFYGSASGVTGLQSNRFIGAMVQDKGYTDV